MKISLVDPPPYPTVTPEPVPGMVFRTNNNDSAFLVVGRSAESGSQVWTISLKDKSVLLWGNTKTWDRYWASGRISILGTAIGLTVQRPG